LAGGTYERNTTTEVHLMASFVFNWTLACVCIAIVFFFLGHTSPVLYAMGVGQNGALDSNSNPAYGGKPLDQGKFVQSLAGVLTNPTSLLLLAGFSAAAILAYVGGAVGLFQQMTSFAAIYLIPLFIYLFIMNYVVMPWSSFFMDSNCPTVSTGVLTPEQTQACQTDVLPSITSGGVSINLKWPILLLFNFFTVWAAITFIRGG
jgi:hypothetical protein